MTGPTPDQEQSCQDHIFSVPKVWPVSEEWASVRCTRAVGLNHYLDRFSKAACGKSSLQVFVTQLRSLPVNYLMLEKCNCGKRTKSLGLPKGNKFKKISFSNRIIPQYIG